MPTITTTIDSLITDADIKAHLSSTADLKYAHLKVAIKSAYNRYVFPIINFEMIDVVEDDELKAEIFELIKKVVINIAAGNDYFKILLELGSSGIRDNTAKESKASKEDKEAHQNSLFDAGFYAIEELLAFLEANKESFELWADSDRSSILSNSFIPTALVFDKIIKINESRRVFLMLQPAIFSIQNRRIKKILGGILFNKILKPIPNDPDAIDEILAKELIEDYIKPIIANLAMASSLLSGGIQIVNNTFVVYDDTNTNKTKGYRTADKDTLAQARRQYTEEANDYINDMNDFLKENQEAFGIVTPENNNTGIGPFYNNPNSTIVMI